MVDPTLPDPRTGRPDPSHEAVAEQAAILRKVASRILPFVSLCYLVAYLDRSNIGFAALTMRSSLQLGPVQFGFAAGVFFLGYLLSELPSNLLMVRFGARRWMARIMVSWGLLAMATALVQGPRSLYVMRFLLGVAEAGFLPGIVIYLAWWFPVDYRSRIFAYFLAAIPVAVVIGSPLSAGLLYLDGVAGLHGWQWLFLIEGAPAVLLGYLCLSCLTDRPDQAGWLTPRERVVLNGLLDPPAAAAAGHGAPVLPLLRDRRVWEMIVISIAGSAGSYGIVFFMPQIVAEFGASVLQTGLLAAVPFLVGALAMVPWGIHSDRTGERRWHVAGPLLLSAIGYGGAAVTAAPAAKLAALSLAATGTYMSFAPFWGMVPSLFRHGREAAAAVAIVSMFGALPGFFGPFLMGVVKEWTGTYAAGFLVIGGVVALGALAAAAGSANLDARPRATGA